MELNKKILKFNSVVEVSKEDKFYTINVETSKFSSSEICLYLDDYRYYLNYKQTLQYSRFLKCSEDRESIADEVLKQKTYTHHLEIELIRRINTVKTDILVLMFEGREVCSMRINRETSKLYPQIINNEEKAIILSGFTGYHVDTLMHNLWQHVKNEA